jgi:hypothetical protein
MASQILYMHWKAVRLGLLPLVIAAFGLPLLVVQGLGKPPGMNESFFTSFILGRIEFSFVFFPMLAGITAVTLGLSTWSWDHQGKHVYALSLPISRSRYALAKFGAGALLALLPTLALYGGGLVASASIELPSALHTYPLALAVRFLFTTVLVYALIFALAAGSIRTTVILLTGFILLLLTGDMLVDAYASLTNQPDLKLFDFTLWLVDLLTTWPGPLQILAGNWSLIDV